MVHEAAREWRPDVLTAFCACVCYNVNFAFQRLYQGTGLEKFFDCAITMFRWSSGELFKHIGHFYRNAGETFPIFKEDAA